MDLHLMWHSTGNRQHVHGNYFKPAIKPAPTRGHMFPNQPHLDHRAWVRVKSHMPL